MTGTLAADVAHEQRVSPGLLASLGLLGTIGPFATDVYLSTFPTMAGDLHTSAAGVQLTLTAFLAGAGSGQIFFGPISDRFGRRRPLIVGAAVCVVASLVAALAPNIGILIAARLVQGLSGSAGMVISRAVIADLARGRAAARALSLMMMVGGLAPVVAPIAGSLLAKPLGWRGLLLLVFAITVLMLLTALFVVPESHPAQHRAQARAARAAAGGGFLSRRFIANTLTFAFGFSAMMSYISASPFLYQVVMGRSAVQYGLLFGLNALALAAMGFLSGRLVRRVAPSRLLHIGVGILSAAALAFALLVVTGAPSGWLALPVFAVVACLGLVFGNATALALAAVPHAAGRGSAVLGALQFGLGAVVSPLVGLGGGHTAAPLAAVLGTAAALALLAHVCAPRHRATRSSVPA